MHLQKSKRDRSFFFSSAWQQKEMHDKNIAKIVSGSKNLPQTHENISLRPISTVPPQGKLIHVLYIINTSDVFQA